MNRREFIKRMFGVTAGLAIVPSVAKPTLSEELAKLDPNIEGKMSFTYGRRDDIRRYDDEWDRQWDEVAAMFRPEPFEPIAEEYSDTEIAGAKALVRMIKEHLMT